MTIPFSAWLGDRLSQAFGPLAVPTGTGEVVVHANAAEAEHARQQYVQRIDAEHQRRLLYAWRLCQ